MSVATMKQIQSFVSAPWLLIICCVHNHMFALLLQDALWEKVNYWVVKIDFFSWNLVEASEPSSNLMGRSLYLLLYLLVMYKRWSSFCMVNWNTKRAPYVLPALVYLIARLLWQMCTLYIPLKRTSGEIVVKCFSILSVLVFDHIWSVDRMRPALGAYYIYC